MFRNQTIKARRIIFCSIFFFIVFFFSAVMSTYQYHQENHERIKSAWTKHNAHEEKIVEAIERKLEEIAGFVDEVLVRSLEAERRSPEQIKKSLQKILFQDPDFIDAGIAFVPYAYDAAIRLFGISCQVKNHNLIFSSLDANRDYTKPGSNWYHQPLAQGKVWIDHVYDLRRQQTMITYSVPFYRSGRKQASGVAYLTFSIRGISRLLYVLDQGEHGYSFIASKDGRFLHHPNNDYCARDVCIDDLFGKLGRSPTSILNEIRLGKETSVFPFTEPETGFSAHIKFWRIPQTDWAVGFCLVDRDQNIPPTDARRFLIRTGILFAISLIFLFIPILGVHRGTIKAWWQFSTGFSSICLFMLCLTLFYAIQFPDSDEPDRITNQFSLNEFIRNHRERTLASRDELPLFIPTGIYIESINFINATDVKISGYIWQQYSDGIHDGISRGFVMLESESANIEKAYHKKTGDRELMGWKFRVVLHEKFNNSMYPFGRENLKIRLWHEDFHQNVVLVPDLASYKTNIPETSPGLLEGIALPSWDIQKSFFSYKDQNYKTSFGLLDYSGLTDFPELYFNIYIRKLITGPFMAHILPIMVILIMMFAIMMLTTKREDMLGRLDAKTMKVITACAGIFLVVVFSHIRLREGLLAKGIVYLEFFYFIIYALIILVPINSFLVSTTENRWIQYRENLLPKILYWPVSQLILLLITLWQCY